MILVHSKNNQNQRKEPFMTRLSILFFVIIFALPLLAEEVNPCITLPLDTLYDENGNMELRIGRVPGTITEEANLFTAPSVDTIYDENGNVTELRMGRVPVIETTENEEIVWEWNTEDSSASENKTLAYQEPIQQPKITDEKNIEDSLYSALPGKKTLEKMITWVEKISKFEMETYPQADEEEFKLFIKKLKEIKKNPEKSLRHLSQKEKESIIVIGQLTDCPIFNPVLIQDVLIKDVWKGHPSHNKEKFIPYWNEYEERVYIHRQLEKQNETASGYGR